MQALLQQLLDQLNAASSPHKAHQQGHTSSAASPTPAAGEWQCSTAAVAAVLSEVLFGSSGAWDPPLAAANLAGSGSAGKGSQGAAAAAAAAAAVFGSAAGQRAVPQSGGRVQDGQWQQQQQLGVVDAGCEEVLLQAVSAVVKPKLWGLPTAQLNGAVGASGATADSARVDKLPAQVRGTVRLCGGGSAVMY
jgi:hypothetical protein